VDVVPVATVLQDEQNIALASVQVPAVHLELQVQDLVGVVLALPLDRPHSLPEELLVAEVLAQLLAQVCSANI
jgi:hypothetical protein